MHTSIHTYVAVFSRGMKFTPDAEPRISTNMASFTQGVNFMLCVEGPLLCVK